MRVTGVRMVMILVVAFGLLATPLALIATTATETQAQAQRNPTRDDCLRNHGYWDRTAQACQYGGSAVTKKAQAYDSAKKACESKGGWFEPKLALCEFEAAKKASYQATGYDQLQQGCAAKGGWYDEAAGICDTGQR